MTTLILPFSSPIADTKLRRSSWLVAVADGVISGLGALLLGQAAIDPDIAVST